MSRRSCRSSSVYLSLGRPPRDKLRQYSDTLRLHLAASHDTVIPDFASGGVYPRTPTVIADCGIIVTYVAMIAAVVVALYSEVAKLFK